jgi:hypothetical protein
MPMPQDPHPMLGETPEAFRQRERAFYRDVRRETLRDPKLYLYSSPFLLVVVLMLWKGFVG